MNAVVASANGARLVDVAEPSPSVGECIVRVTAALLTSIDLPKHEPSRRVSGTSSDALAAHVVLGQSFVGTVETLPPDDGAARSVRDSPRDWIGRRVVVHPIVRCGRCDRCLAGLSSHCEQRAVLGVTRAGGLAQRVAVPLVNLVAIPDALDDERAVFAVTVARALEAMRIVRVEGKAYISVLGDDLVALVATQVMTQLNVAVRIIARRAGTIATAEKLGVKHRLADEVGRRGDQHVVVDAVGDAESLGLAMQLARPKATILLFATSGAIELAPLVESALRLQGCGHGPLSEAVALLASRGIEVVSLIERRITLSAAADACSEGRSGTLVRV
ncbi:MAG: alcohol dehydrogenase catalytic domain-containing protein [Phycisphaerae bacterium]|nr:alcohol dehydrogenase catalytic domain-containing protein [Phycisphaerae bacterium]